MRDEGHFVEQKKKQKEHMWRNEEAQQDMALARRGLFGSVANALIKFGSARTSFSYAPDSRKHGKGSSHEPTYR